MKAVQLLFDSENWEDYQVANLDETALNWGLGPTYIYCSTKADRAEQEITDLKARITMVPTVLANGTFLPSYFILKHSVSSAAKPDQTTMRVVKKLHETQGSGFTEADGWDLKTWERNLNGQNHKCIYIIHRLKGHVITSQHKAWNDQIRFAMMIDLILAPYAERNGGKLLLWMDNCSLHHGSDLKPILDAAGITVGYLPPNMTWILQVLDLVVNGPLKAHIRRLRASRILVYFQSYKLLFEKQLLLPENQRSTPKWDCPKPEMKQCILDMIHLLETDFCDPKFQAGIKKSFINTGCFHKFDKSFVVFQ